MHKHLVFFVTLLTLFAGCSSAVLVSTQKKMPVVYEDINKTHQKKNDITISLFRLHNFTDTPRAGMRAGNILEGILKARGYHIISHVTQKEHSFKKARKIAKEDGAKYMMIGGVSEWRYKTGIDGEPAVSIQLSLYKVKNKKLIWSATGSDNDWGNASIGTTVQALFEEMIDY